MNLCPFFHVENSSGNCQKKLQEQRSPKRKFGHRQATETDPEGERSCKMQELFILAPKNSSWM